MFWNLLIHHQGVQPLNETIA